MDLRIQRTLAAIRSAYTSLRAKKPIEKITVTELTALAQINKATFYLHYSDIYALADDVENRLIDEILLDVSQPERFYENRRKYAENVITALLAHSAQIGKIFSGSRADITADKIEQRLKMLLYSRYPGLNTKNNDVILSFMIQGTFHTVTRAADRETEESVRQLAGQMAGLLDDEG